MRTPTARRTGVAGLALLALLLAGCGPQKPDMDTALTLFQEGRLNEARWMLGRYIREKPFNPEVREASQHILLIRRIKKLEAAMVRQWVAGDLAAARRTIGIIRFLHATYVDSAQIFGLLDYPSPGQAPAADRAAQVGAPGGPGQAGTFQQVFGPLMLPVLDRQERLAIHLALRWEAYRQAPHPAAVDGGVALSAQPQTDALLEDLDRAYSHLRDWTDAAEREEIEALGSQLEQMLATLEQDGSGSPGTAELEWQALKYSLFDGLLTYKATLHSSR